MARSSRPVSDCCDPAGGVATAGRTAATIGGVTEPMEPRMEKQDISIPLTAVVMIVRTVIDALEAKGLVTRDEVLTRLDHLIEKLDEAQNPAFDPVLAALRTLSFPLRMNMDDLRLN